MTCEICIRPLDSAERAVSCGRPSCGKTFHPFCVDLNLTLWNALEAGIGLEWFCAGCRVKPVEPQPEVTVGMVDLLARIDRLEAKVDAGFVSCQKQLDVVVGKIDVRFTEEVPISTPVKKSRLIHPSVDPEPKVENVTARPEVVLEKEKIKEQSKEQSGIFPDKVWLKIFGHLSGYQLSQARLICRNWNQIIGRSLLMDKLEIQFLKDSILDKNCDEVTGLAASNSRYTKVVLEDVTIIKAALWWESIGEHLHTLNLTRCSMTAEDLLGILKNTPKLRCLTFDVKLSGCPAVDFEIKTLEELTLGKTVHRETAEMFRKLCPSLKVLSLLNRVYPDSCNLIYSARETLESLSLSGVHIKMLDVLRNLSLKRFQTRSIDSNFIASFSVAQPDIDELNVILTSSTFNRDATDPIFPKNLKRLNVESNKSFVASLVQSMPQLKYLRIKNPAIPRNSLQFGYDPLIQHVNIEILEIIWPHDSILFLNGFSNLRSVSISRCFIESWNNFFTHFVQLKRLNHLELSDITTEINREDFFEYIENLRELKLSSCAISENMLNKLFTLCPCLEKVSMCSMNEVNDNVIRTMCQKLKRLKSLELISLQKITNDSVQHIVRYCSSIEKVRFGGLDHITKEALQRLKGHRNLHLIYKRD